MARREDELYNRKRESKKAQLRRRRRRKKIVRICLVVMSLVVLAVTVPYIIKNIAAGTVFLESPASVSVDSADISSSAAGTSPTGSADQTQSAEQTAAPEVTADSEDGTTAPAVSEQEPVEETAESSSALKTWTYSSDTAMPDGDIVDMHASGYSYERMRRDLDLLRQRYPDVMNVYQFGTSLDNRELLDAVVGYGTADRDVIIQYSMHAREHIVTNLGMKQLEELLKGMASASYNGQSYREIFSKVRLHIIPMMNPDGVMISQEGLDAITDEGLRKDLMQVFENDKVLGKASPDISEYATTWKANARSVDLNRNFDTPGWTTEMGTRQPSCSRYPGAGPNSEPEVKALIALTDSLNCVGQIAYHCHGRLVYWDYGMGKSDPALFEKDRQLAQLFSDLTATDELPGYTVVSTVDDGQNPGGCSDYYMQVRHIPAVTVEVGRKFKPDGSYNDAPLSIDQIDGIYQENARILPAVAQLFMS